VAAVERDDEQDVADTVPDMAGRHGGGDHAAAVAATGAVMILLASWLPWLETGNGYTVVSRLLTLEPDVEALSPRWLLATWFLLPAAAIVAWLGPWLVADARWVLRICSVVLIASWSHATVSIVRSDVGALPGPTVAGLGVLLVAWASLPLPQPHGLPPPPEG
jgi:hypothetical protein